MQLEFVRLTTYTNCLQHANLMSYFSIFLFPLNLAIIMTAIFIKKSCGISWNNIWKYVTYKLQYAVAKFCIFEISSNP